MDFPSMFAQLFDVFSVYLLKLALGWKIYLCGFGFALFIEVVQYSFL